MPLTCDIEFEFGWYFHDPLEWDTPLSTVRGRRCASCKGILRVGQPANCFPRWRPPRDNVEERIYGEGGEVTMAPLWLCPTCAELYSALCDLGFCVTPDENMRDLVAEYQHLRTELA